MKQVMSIFLFFVLLAPALGYAQTTLKSGDKAPDFISKDQDGKTVSLKQYKGKKVVLYFYPKDNSSGCTAEACSFRDNFNELTKQGYTIIGVSTDDETSHKGFIEKNSLPFSLLADVDKSIHMKYGVWSEKERNGVMGFSTTRTTFLIDQKGMISQVIEKVDTRNSASQILGLN
ncbi:MAG: thioredoxin-dependent thiol peroxidase [Pedobacter sp.]|uniref:thioredoxin-dependent thiol peroxidase n=1 Tax=Pedobacter sp. TaxID=1411316 RepID=UPI00339215CF